MGTIDSILKLLDGISITHGASLRDPKSLTPLNARINAESEYSLGVLSAILEVYLLIANTPDGRKAISDLGFKPLCEDFKCPGGCWSND